MIIFGFSHIVDRFAHEVNGARVELLTEQGVHLSGPVSDLRITQLATSRDALADKADQIVDAAAKASQAGADGMISGAYYSPLLVNLTIDSANVPVEAVDTWATIARSFAKSYVRMDGKDTDVPGFLAAIDAASPATTPVVDSGDALIPHYVPRLVDRSRTDLDVLRRAREWGLHVLLEGPTGTGKTTAARAAHGDDLLVVPCFDGMLAQDLIGQYLPVPGEPGSFQWVDGPLLTAMLEGRPVLLDDASWIPPGVQALLLPALDHQRSLRVADRPEVNIVEAVDGFSVVLNINPGVGYGLIGPVQDRMGFTIEVPVDLQAAEQLGVPRGFLVVAQKLQAHAQAEALNGIDRWVPPMRSLLRVRDLVTIFDEHFAAGALLAECPAGEQRDTLKELLTDELGFGHDTPELLTARSI